MGFAYLDAGSGSMLLSAAVGGVAAAGVAVRQVRHRLRSKFSRGGGSEEPTTGDEAAAEASADDTEAGTDEVTETADAVEDEATPVGSDT
jgi:hypothetical protein